MEQARPISASVTQGITLRISATLFVFLGALAVSAAWYFGAFHNVLMGDDLAIVYNAQHGGVLRSLYSVLTHADGDKYRPVLDSILWLLIKLFGNNFAGYFIVNIVTEAAAAAVLYKIALRLSRGDSAVSIGAALAFVVCRFGYFSVVQLIGLLEGLALLLALCVVYNVVRAYQESETKSLFWASALFALAVYADERYVALLPFVLFCGLFHRQLRHEKTKLLLYISAIVLIAASNFIIKTFILKIHFLEGTAGQAVSPDSTGILRFLWSGLLNCLGFNVGPDYLSGRDISELGLAGYVIGALTALPLCGLAFYWARTSAKAVRPIAERSLLALALFVPLLLSASITIRQEFRWLYVCYAITLLCSVGIYGFLRSTNDASTRAARIGVAAFILLSMVGAVVFRPFVSETFFERGLSVTQAILTEASQQSSDSVILFTHGDPAPQWYTDHGALFQEYGRPITISFMNDMGQPLGHDQRVTTKTLLLDVRGGQVADVTWQRQEIADLTRSYVSFIKDFADGAINSMKKVSSPNGRGVIPMQWPMRGLMTPTISIVSGFRYSFPNVRVRPHSDLVFYDAKPFSAGVSDRAFVDVTPLGESSARVFVDTLRPAASAISWKSHRISLRRFSGKTVTITFGADALGDATAAWAAFANPLIIQ